MFSHEEPVGKTSKKLRIYPEVCGADRLLYVFADGIMERQSQGTILVVSAGLLVVRAAFPWFKLSGNGVFFISICEHFCMY
jgi:hypothetical protein